MAIARELAGFVSERGERAISPISIEEPRRAQRHDSLLFQEKMLHNVRQTSSSGSSFSLDMLELL